MAAKEVTMTPETLAPFFTKLHEDVLRMLAPTVAHGRPIVIAPFTSPPHWSSTPIPGGSGEGAGGLADGGVEVKEDEDASPEETNGELSFLRPNKNTKNDGSGLFFCCVFFTFRQIVRK